MNFQFTPVGSSRRRKARRDASCAGPSMVLLGELAGSACSGERWRRVSIMKKEAGPCVNWKYEALG